MATAGAHLEKLVLQQLCGCGALAGVLVQAPGNDGAHVLHNTHTQHGTARHSTTWHRTQEVSFIGQRQTQLNSTRRCDCHMGLQTQPASIATAAAVYMTSQGGWLTTPRKAQHWQARLYLLCCAVLCCAAVLRCAGTGGCLLLPSHLGEVWPARLVIELWGRLLDGHQQHLNTPQTHECIIASTHSNSTQHCFKLPQ